MLKIYLCKVKYELHNEDRIINLSTDSHYIIKDDAAAISNTIELGAYTKDAMDCYNYSSDLHQTRKGIRARYWTWDCSVYTKQWITPNAKLVIHISYEENICSMKRLMELPATDVIAYLKQEGLNIQLPS